jgi:hypothetical protein
MPRRQHVVKLENKSLNVLRMCDSKLSDEIIDRVTKQTECAVEIPFSYPSYTLTSKAALPTCPETCKICAQHYLPESIDWNPENPRPMIPHSDIEAAQITSDYVKCINSDRDAIRARLKTDADLLLKRWQRKSIEKRATVVRTAMPKVQARRFRNPWQFYEQKRVFREYLSTIDKKKRKLGFERYIANAMQAFNTHNDSQREQNLLPFVDVETLSQDPMSLFVLLHYRSDSDIADWVMHDSEQLKAGFNWTMGPPVFNPHCVIMYGTHLGRLIPWNKHSAHRHDIIGYPKAVLILEAQAALFAFLRKMVKILLEPSLQEATAGHQQWDVLVQSDFGRIGPIPLLCRRTEAFRSPPQLDMADIVKSLIEQTDVISDELWLLQTDSAYFHAHLLQAKNNETYDRLSTEWREQWVLGFALCYSVWADNFQTALIQATSVLKMQKELGGDVRPGKSLPTEYEAILVLFQRHLEQLLEGQVRDLRCLVPQERSFQDCLRFTKDCEPKITIPAEKLLRTNPMLWSLSRLYIGNHALPPTFHLAYIDHLMREDAKNEKSRISPLLAAHISRMIVVDDIISSLRYHRPRHGVSIDAGTLAKLAESQPRTLLNRQQAAFGHVYRTSELMWPKLQAFMKLPLPPSDEPAVLLKYLKPLDKASLKFWDWACGSFMYEIKQSGLSEGLYWNPMCYTQIVTTVGVSKWRALKYTELEHAAVEQGENFQG